MARKYTTAQPTGFRCPKCDGELNQPNRTEWDGSNFYCPACRKIFSRGTIFGLTRRESAIKSTREAGPRANNSTGYKGVVLDKKTGRFIAKITVGGKELWLGRHSTAENAALAYNLKALEVFGPNAYQNDIAGPRNAVNYNYGTRGHNPHA